MGRLLGGAMAAVALVVAGTALAANLEAAQPPADGPGGPGGRVARGPSQLGKVIPDVVQNNLKLTDEQKQQLAVLQKSFDSKLDEILTDEQKRQYKELKDNSSRAGPRANGTGGYGPVGPGVSGRSNQSAEMVVLLKSFNLTAEQQAKYDAACMETSRKMRDVHQGKVDGTLTQDEVLKQALAAHKGLNAKVKEILSAEQYAQWEPLREADHHKTAEAHKQRDEEAAKKKAEQENKPQPQ